MGVPTSEVSYNSATTGRADHEDHKGHVVALEKQFPDLRIVTVRRKANCAQVGNEYTYGQLHNYLHKSPDEMQTRPTRSLLTAS
jgi:hypothetical protein